MELEKNQETYGYGRDKRPEIEIRLYNY